MRLLNAFAPNAGRRPQSVAASASGTPGLTAQFDPDTLHACVVPLQVHVG
jgi:hypothetical protein